MAKDEPLLATAEARLVGAGVSASSESVRATLRRSSSARAVPLLARLAALRDGGSALDIERTLAEGGMGVIALATQRSLDRKVVVKTSRAPSPEGVARLVREAEITGALEHPNIVPVHDLSLAPDGSPRIVLKRVEGATWTERMRDAGAARERFGARDLLEWNVQTLMQVCQAAHFAHSRGVVHRDLKPDNVMVGNFGEVYVLDWGIAVREREPEGVDATDAATVGTPVYMAPEMLLGDAVDRRTDVYLLGAILFEILAGRPPHEAPDLRALVESVLATPPRLPEGAPEELAALARACLARRPEDRPSSAEDVRRALAGFLRHRGSAELARRAEDKTRELEEAIGSEPDARAQRLYGECVFGFRAALEAWPENDVARAGLLRAVRAMVERDLAAGLAKTAAMRLHDLPSPDAPLEGRVARALGKVADDERRVAELRRLEVEIDPATGQRIRRRIAVGLCSIWIATEALDEVLVRGTRLDTLDTFLTQGTVHLVLAVLVVARYWRYFSNSKLNRQLAAMVLFAMLAQVAAYLGARVSGYPVEATQSALFFLWFAVLGMMAVTIVPAMWPSALAFLAGFFVTAVRHDLQHLAGIVINAVMLVNAASAWRSARAGSGAAPRDEGVLR